MKIFELQNDFESRPIVYVDMDGVLADMFGEVASREGAPHWRQARKLKDKIDQVAQEPGFFHNLTPLPNAGKLIANVAKIAGEYSILSSPMMSNVEQSSREKVEWLQKYLKNHQPQSVLFDHHKEKYARQANGTPNILIDDWETNINLWEANGGIGILYKDKNIDKVIKTLIHALEGLVPVEDRDDASEINAGVKEKIYTNQQVLKYVKGIHNEYHLEKPIMKHKFWVLRAIPIEDLKTPEFYDQDDPYRRVIDLDWDHIENITVDDILKKPVVADDKGWLLDGNHRFTAARAYGLKNIRCLVPYHKN